MTSLAAFHSLGEQTIEGACLPILGSKIQSNGFLGFFVPPSFYQASNVIPHN